MVPFKRRLSDVCSQFRRVRCSGSSDGGVTGGACNRASVSSRSSARFWERSDSSPCRKLAFFRTYCDDDCTAIRSRGMERLCEDMRIKSGDVRLVVLAWHLRTDVKWEIPSKAFVDACCDLDVDTPSLLCQELDEMVYEARRHFKEFYRFAFRFELEPGQKSLPKAAAVQLWRCVLPVCSGDAERFIHGWFEFLKAGDITGVSRDLWDGFLEFSQAVEEDFSNFSEDDAWPSVVDEFVAHSREHVLLADNKVPAEV